MKIAFVTRHAVLDQHQRIQLHHYFKIRKVESFHYLNRSAHLYAAEVAAKYEVPTVLHEYEDVMITQADRVLFAGLPKQAKKHPAFKFAKEMEFLRPQPQARQPMWLKNFYKHT